METAGPGADGTRLHIRMLGPLEVRRGGIAVPLPPSRKTRALLGYLALADRPQSRTRLSELLWEVPNDPRGELRWSLTKLRRILDEHDCTHVIASGDVVALDLEGCFVDAREVASVEAQGIGPLDGDRLRLLVDLFAGELLEGLELTRSPAFQTWLVS